MSDLKIVK